MSATTPAHQGATVHRYEIAARIAEQAVVAIVRETSAERAYAAASALLSAGQRVVEVSTTLPGAIEVVAELARDFGEDALVGVGTVLDETTTRLAALAGARFVVSPAVNSAVLRTAHRYGMATLPGALTATEALRAVEEGADFVKLFPASAYGPRSVRDLLAALPQVALVPTGGVSLDNAAEYIRAGAVAVGMGSALTSGPAEEVAGRIDALRATLAEAKRLAAR